MNWSQLALQYCLELGFGVLLAMAFVPNAPVGRMFYRMMGTTAVLPVAVGVGFGLDSGALVWSDVTVLAGAAAVLAWPFHSGFAGPPRGRGFWVALGAGLLATAAAVISTLARAAPTLTSLELALVGTSALATGAVAGSVGLAMVLGHWYLTVPKLEIRHLARLNTVTVAAMVASILLVSATCVVFGDALASVDPPLFGATGLFYLGTRVVVGLFFPLAFAAMTRSALRFQNTRSATGILYASTVLVLIGTAVSVSLQDSYGIPL